MPGTLTEKIISEHLVAGGDDEVELRVDQILLEDATGTMACLQFGELGAERVAVPTVSYVDHNVLQFDDKNPDDHEARFELASAKMAAGDRDAAADALLEIVRRDREWNEGAARKRFLQLLEAQGLEEPWSSTQRRRLSAVLFT